MNFESLEVHRETMDPSSVSSPPTNMLQAKYQRV